jgi:hypothetical protein
MAVINPTSSDMRIGSAGTNVTMGIAGEALSAFEFVYQDSTDSNEWKKADNTSEAKSIVAGCVLQSAADGDPVVIVLPGGVIKSASSLWTKGETYVISGTSGKLQLAEDVGAGDHVSICGVASSTTTLAFNVTATLIEI